MNTVQKWRRASQGRPSNLPVGLEPTTPSLQDWRSVQLSYESLTALRLVSLIHLVKRWS